MSESGAGPAGADIPARSLRRSTSDRIISGVCGGLGQYFGVDPVIFRVLFAVLSFFGGVGLLAYGVAWLLIPEPGTATPLLDKALGELRVRKVPPWLVVLGGAVVVWLAWFSWWAPGTLPAILLLAVVVLVLMHRLVARPQPMTSSPPWAAQAPAAPLWTPPPGGVAPATDTTTGSTPDAADTMAAERAAPDATAAPTPADIPVSLAKEGPAAPDPISGVRGGPAQWPVVDAESWQQPGSWQQPAPGEQTTRLIPPLNDTRRSMQAWLTEASEAHRERVRRRRPIKVGVGLALLLGWGFVALLDAINRVPFPAYLWTGLAILTAGLVVSVITRRMMLSLLLPLLILAVIAVGLGGTPASLSDGSGDIGWRPTAQSQLSTYRQFAGRSTLDLTALTLTSPADVTITQAAGAVFVKLPAGLNATVVADVHFGDIRNGDSQAVGQYQGGMNVHLQLDPPATATGQPITIHVKLTDGHVQVDRS
ncbi:MAG TPA: PspC domain-containing protein [Jatrophihabitans sp.]|nr:PspC domain-containing protein [Jatrophihabitans sp.]